MLNIYECFLAAISSVLSFLSIIIANKLTAQASYDVNIKTSAWTQEEYKVDSGEMSRFHHTFIRLTSQLSKCQHFQAILHGT